ncbi:MDR family MFS transporter [Kocuria sp.]|uniref:MDR family MFS transporter n=1 Tax=Kocuria sp. TaxID=1871328 RepID=UPI0026DD93EA|nr:MDR family MFS transporter [Kocuria sp.]MDO4919019.1 MDR family MFS transporter [Kocuria sp.]
MPDFHPQEELTTGQLQAVADRAAEAALQTEPERPTTRHVTGAIAVLVLSALVMILNETVLTVALPHLMAEFHVGADTVQWLTTGFLLTMAVVIPTTGWMLQRFTTRAMFTAALGCFLLGTVLVTFAPAFGVILAGRIIQAFGTAVVLPLLMTTTLTYVPPQHRGTVMGLNSVVISVAPAIGPTLSGIVVGGLGWRYVFGLMLPIAAVVLVVGLLLLRSTGETRAVPLDGFSVALSAVAFGGLVFGLGSIGELFQGALFPLAAVAVGAVVLAFFIRRQVRLQRRDDAALLDLRPFTRPNFRLSVAIVMVCMAAMLGTVMVLPILLQNGMGIDVLTVGLILLPSGLVQGVLSPVIGRVYDRYGPRPLVIPGAVLLCAGQWWFATLTPDTPVSGIIARHVVFSIGMAMLMTPLMTVSLGCLPRNLYGHGSAILNTLQQLGGAAGTALLVAAMTVGASVAARGGATEALAVVDGARWAFVVGGAITLVALVCAPFVRPLDREDERTTV